jgi:hypothetical protein
MALRLTGVAEERVATRAHGVEMVTLPPGRVTIPGLPAGASVFRAPKRGVQAGVSCLPNEG